MELQLSDIDLQNIINIKMGVFFPVDGFMNHSEYLDVLNNYSYRGQCWPVPLTLDVSKEVFEEVVEGNELKLKHDNEIVSVLTISDKFQTSPETELPLFFKTSDKNHPGVAKELSRSEYRLGGSLSDIDQKYFKEYATPSETKALFKEKGWETICGFQTRNPVHRAHEYIQRVALDRCDGLFIHPLIGWKKVGDFSEKAVLNGYQAMIDHYYPKEKIHFDGLKTAMFYSGPRDAIFHALIRANYGCTHFTIGRDHAGVGDYYGIYEAQDLALKLELEGRLPIKIIAVKEPKFCLKCDQYVTQNHCRHGDDQKESISGTMIRKLISNKKFPEGKFMRKEVAQALIDLDDELFITKA